MPRPEAPKHFVEVRSVKPKMGAKEPFFTARAMLELGVECLLHPFSEGHIKVDRENGVISLTREVKRLPVQNPK